MNLYGVYNLMTVLVGNTALTVPETFFQLLHAFDIFFCEAYFFPTSDRAMVVVMCVHCACRRVEVRLAETMTLHKRLQTAKAAAAAPAAQPAPVRAATPVQPAPAARQGGKGESLFAELLALDDAASKDRQARKIPQTVCPHQDVLRIGLKAKVGEGYAWGPGLFLL